MKNQPTNREDPARTPRRWCATASLLASAPAAAHTDAAAAAGNPWTAWPFAPDIIVASTLLAGLYLAGMLRRRGREGTRSWARHASFFAGLLAIVGALQSPLDSLAERSFYMHQVQHLLLYAIGPLLLVFAQPQAELASGLPEPLRRAVLAPVARSGTLRSVFGFLARPAVATLLFIGSMYFWQLPRVHDLTLLDRLLHYAMHATMLFTGLVFFWRVLEPRPPPLGTSFGTRVVMVTAAIAGTVPLGAYLALKSVLLYPAYDALGRLPGLEGLADESLGGLLIWIPGGVICGIAILIVLRSWGRQESRSHERRMRGLAAGPNPGEAPLRSRNRGVAVRLAFTAAAVLIGVIAVISLGQALL